MKILVTCQKNRVMVMEFRPPKAPECLNDFTPLKESKRPEVPEQVAGNFVFRFRKWHKVGSKPSDHKGFHDWHVTHPLWPYMSWMMTVNNLTDIHLLSVPRVPSPRLTPHNTDSTFYIETKILQKKLCNPNRHLQGPNAFCAAFGSSRTRQRWYFYKSLSID
jgi:hypothetical protein